MKSITPFLHYHQCAPEHPLLQKYVECVYWLTSSESGSYFCIPNCKISLSFILKGKVHYLNQNGLLAQIPSCAIFGMVQEPVEVCVSSRLQEISIVFKPHGLHHFIGEPVDNLLGIDLMSLSTTGPQFEALYNQLGKNRDTDQQLKLIETFLLYKLIEIQADSRIDKAIQQILQPDEVISIQAISEQLGITTRRLHSLFEQKVGISPKLCSQLIRFYTSLKYERNGSDESFARHAQALGYHDQAHFIRDFKRFTGTTPLKYFNNRALTDDFHRLKRWTRRSYGQLAAQR
jgi:AraC-like DNA-binding protein